MSNNISPEQPVNFKRVSDSCMEFQLKNFLFISDNNYLFIAPQQSFCRSCFQRRYLTQMMGNTKTTQIGGTTINLAKKLDVNGTRKTHWQVYMVASQQLAINFVLMPYEDCPTCGTQKNHNEDEAAIQYKKLLNYANTPDLNAIKNQIFSFGFARGRSISQQIVGLNNAEFDKLLNNNYHARIVFRMVSPDGHYSDSSATGFSADKELAELKSQMEYLERYAFNMQTCHFKTNKFDEKIISDYLKLYQYTASKDELKHIKHQASWGINLSTKEIRAIPLSFIYNKRKISFIKPCSNGFGAHTDFSLSLCSSILELIERDAFVRFWYDPQRAFNFKPDSKVQKELDSIITIMKTTLNNDELTSNCYVLQSPTKLPVVLLAISSSNFSKPPALSFGCGASFKLNDAITGALEELRLNVVNLVKGVTVINGFLTRRFSTKIENIPDRMNLYATSAPRKKLKFLDNNNNPLVDGIVEDESQSGLDALVDRFNKIKFDIYGIDCTPQCFQDKSVFVTRAFSPQLYPIQFEQENVFNLKTGTLSAQKKLPHFFI